ncbi:sialidase family protein [uncultured Bacteroides sp.]|uniref:sialidase family protein n=1 Tax=uncultured Bacteroides sp. TaxID=162156 RepID=UPI002595969E|nr:sialidase family protein [uncultured Bacteroides sp.]
MAFRYNSRSGGRILFVMVCKFTDGPYCNYIVYSDDEGKTWPYKYVFNSLPGAYSTIVKCEDGSIGIYYEDGTMSDHYSMNFISMPLEWILR